MQEFESLVRPLMDFLYHPALRLTRNPQDAQDLLQDTYLRAYRFFHRFELGTNFRAWVFRLLMNTFINRYRKQKRDPRPVELEKVEYALDSTDFAISDSASLWEGGFDLHNVIDDQVKEALDKIPREFRAVVLLADVEGLARKEIASTLEIPIGTAMSRLSRGRKQLQRVLARYAVSRGYVYPRVAYQVL